MPGAAYKDASDGSLIYVDKFEHPTSLPNESRKRCEVILWDLHLRGPVVDPSGKAVSKLVDRLAAIGWDMPTVAVNRIVDGLGDRGGQHGDLYPYTYISRQINGKRTYDIRLIVDPNEVPFPPNPFSNRPAFHPLPASKGKRGRDPGPAKTDAGGETFARQRQFEEVVEAPVVEEPEAELEELEPVPDEPELEPLAADTITEPVVGTLQPFRSESTARSNGADQVGSELTELTDLPDDLFADLEEAQPRTAMEMVSGAISLLSDAMAAHAGEQVHLAADTLDRHIDARLGEYRLLQERLDRTEGQLRHTVVQYEKAVEIVRTQRRQLIALQKEVARLQPTAPTSV